MNLTKLNVPAYSDRLGICTLCKTMRVVLRGILIAEMQNCRLADVQTKQSFKVFTLLLKSVNTQVVSYGEHKPD